MILNWQGTWSPYSTYQVGDVVFYLTASYIALDINTNTAPIQNTLGVYWSPFAVGATGPQGPQGVAGQVSTIHGPTGASGSQGDTGVAGQGFTWRNTWSSANIYNVYDCVYYTDGNSYICIATNVTATPGTDISKWNILAGASIVSPIYSAATTVIPSPVVGAKVFVSDATANTFGAPYISGGAHTVPVWSNGISWYIG